MQAKNSYKYFLTFFGICHGAVSIALTFRSSLFPLHLRWRLIESSVPMRGPRPFDLESLESSSRRMGDDDLETSSPLSYVEVELLDFLYYDLACIIEEC